MAHLTDRNKRTTDTISSHRTVRRKAHRLLGQKIDLRYPRAYLENDLQPDRGAERLPPNAVT